MARKIESKYFVEAAAKLLDVLESFSNHEEELSTTEVAARTGLGYTSAFRLLYTLETRGYVMRAAGKKRFLLAPNRKRFRIGYATLGKIRFAKEVTWGIISAAKRRGIMLIIKDNELSPSKALLNVDELIADKIDLLVEFQWHEATAHLIAAKCHKAGIPVIAITFPQPGAYYFGANDYEAGQMAGDYICQFVRKEWNGDVDAFYVLLGKKMQSTQETRKVGLLHAISKGLPSLNPCDIRVPAPAFAPHDGYGFTKVFPFPKTRKSSRRVLIAALTDPLAIGAERAIGELGMNDFTMIIGHGGAHDARARLAKGGPFAASIAYFPESYGERVITLALKILGGESVPLISHTHHVVLTKENLPEYYPLDCTL
jgi:ribose transport system substrate-binding protein